MLPVSLAVALVLRAQGLAVILLELTLYFMLLSLISVGGMPSVLPELQRYVVDVKGWMSPQEFIQIFAVGQAAPGPNVLIASLVGWQVGGLAGALLALAGDVRPGRGARLVGVGSLGALQGLAVAHRDPARDRADRGRL